MLWALFGFGMGIIVARFQRCNVVFVLRAVLCLLMRHLMVNGAKCFRCLMLMPSGPMELLFVLFEMGRRRLKGIHSRSDTNRTGAEGLSFCYPRLLYCLDQMLAVMLLSQHRVSSSKTFRPRAPCGARCIGHAVSTWSAVFSEAPHSQFGEGARPHLCMDK